MKFKCRYIISGTQTASQQWIYSHSTYTHFEELQEGGFG